jgi:sugar phosphate isomerase/epimerase
MSSPDGRPFELSLAPGAGTPIASAADLDRYLGAVADAGFPSVSLGLQQVAFALDEHGGLDRVAALVDRHGLQVPDVLSVAIRRDADGTLATARDLVRLAAEIGAQHILVLLFTGLRDDSFDTLSRIADLAADAGLRLAFEFTPGSAVSNIGDALALVDRIGTDRMGVMIDTWHFFRGDSTWEQLETIPLPRISYVQFCDALPVIGDDVMHETIDRRTWPALGEFDLVRFADTLRGRGWTGLVSVEVLSEVHRLLDDAEYTALAYDTTVPYWVEARQ